MAPLVCSALALFAANLVRAEDGPVLKNEGRHPRPRSLGDGSSWSKSFHCWN